MLISCRFNESARDFALFWNKSPIQLAKVNELSDFSRKNIRMINHLLFHI